MFYVNHFCICGAIAILWRPQNWKWQNLSSDSIFSKRQQPPEGLFQICTLSVHTIQNLNIDLGDSLFHFVRFWSSKDITRIGQKIVTIPQLKGLLINLYTGLPLRTIIFLAGLSPAGAEGRRAPRKIVENEVPPHDFSISPLYELLCSAPKPSQRGQILETDLIHRLITCLLKNSGHEKLLLQNINQ